MPVYYYKNKETGEVIEHESSIADIDNFFTDVGDPDRLVWFRLIQKPAIFKRLIPSGFGIRESDSAWQAGKEAAALDDSTLDMPVHSKERQEIKAEAKRIRNSVKK